MEQLQKLIDEYVKWTQENRMAGKKIAVYLGLQVEQSPKHAAFYEAVGEWYLIAIQNYAKDFLGELSTEEKAQLGEEYRKKYPSGRRLPLQNEIYRLLSGEKKKPFWKWHINPK